MYGESLLIRHHFIRQTSESTTISQHQYNVRTSTNEYPVNPPNLLIHRIVWKRIAAD